MSLVVADGDDAGAFAGGGKHGQQGIHRLVAVGYVDDQDARQRVARDIFGGVAAAAFMQGELLLARLADGLDRGTALRIVDEGNAAARGRCGWTACRTAGGASSWCLVVHCELVVKGAVKRRHLAFVVALDGQRHGLGIGRRQRPSAGEIGRVGHHQIEVRFVRAAR